MTALELNAEIYRAMGEIANDETLLAKVLKYVKGLAPAKKTKEDAGWATRFVGAWEDDRMIVLLTRLLMTYAAPELLTILISSYERLSS